MPDHGWSGDEWDDEQAAEAVEVHRVQPYEAVKPYRCPGCDHEIAVGEGHVAVVPVRDRDARRHWHRGCWHREERRRA